MRQLRRRRAFNAPAAAEARILMRQLRRRRAFNAPAAAEARMMIYDGSPHRHDGVMTPPAFS